MAKTICPLYIYTLSCTRSFNNNNNNYNNNNNNHNKNNYNSNMQHATAAAITIFNVKCTLL